jgi:molybdopterin converting factor small subunit
MQVEFFGLPRERAGVSSIEIPGSTLGQLLRNLALDVPSMGEFISASGHGVRLHPTFVANLNGDRFVSDPDTPLGDEDHLLILSADAGG